jgi:hypothetical protein
MGFMALMPPGISLCYAKSVSLLLEAIHYMILERFLKSDNKPKRHSKMHVVVNYFRIFSENMREEWYEPFPAKHPL